MKNYSELTEEQTKELFKIVFESNHSNGFMKAEVKDMLTDPDYWFNEYPKENYKENVINYLKENNFELPTTKIWN